MTIWRGEGGGGDATTDSEINLITTLTNSANAASNTSAAAAASATSSELAAQASEDAAAISETNAASSAAAALVSEGAASVSAAAALVSENNAAASALSVNDTNLVHIAGTETITGAKTFTNATVISNSSASTALRITQTGTGNALFVEDSTNPDATPFVVNASGNVGVGIQTPGVLLHLQNNTQAAVYLDTGPNNGQISFRRYNTSVSAPTIVAFGDDLGLIAFSGYDGAGQISAAQILGEVDGTPGTNDMPGRLVFSTTADGAATPTERIRIDSAGNVGVGTSSLGAARFSINSDSVSAFKNHRFSTDANSAYHYTDGNFFAGSTTANTTNLITNNAVRVRIDTTGNVTPGATNTQTLGASGNVWSNVYATTLNGNLTGGTISGTTGTFSGDVQMASLNGSAISLRNKIINGNMRIAQRGTSTTGVSTNSTFIVDRFRTGGQVTSAVVTTSQASDGPNTNLGQSARVTVTTADNAVAAGDVFGIVQVIEGYNIVGLFGNTFTLSFWVRSSKTGTHCVRLTNSAPDRIYIAEYTVIAANTWEYKTITVSGGLTTAGTWDLATGTGLNVGWALMVGSTFQTTAGAWQTGNFWGTANQVNCLDTLGNIFAITGVQLEAGPVATPFEQRPYGMELALCQRYYEVIHFPAQTSGNTSYGYFKATKRASPTMAYISGATGAGLAPTGLDAVVQGTYAASAANTVWSASSEL